MKKFLRVSVLSLACLGLTASVALANYGDNNKISGYAKEKGTLIPIKGAKVKVYTTSGKKKDSDTTSKKGKYSIKDLSEKKYVVKVTAAGFHNPSNLKKNTISKTVKVNGSTKKNFYFVK